MSVSAQSSTRSTEPPPALPTLARSAKFVAMRLSGRDYAANGRPETAAALREQGAQLCAEIDDRAARTGDPAMPTLVDSFAEYARNIDNIVNLRQAQDKLTTETLRPLGVQATQALDNLIEAADRDDREISVAAGHVLRQFMQLQIELNHVLEGNEPALGAAAEEAARRLAETLKMLSAMGGNETLANRIKAVDDPITPYLDAFHEARSVNANLLGIAGKMPPIAGRISGAAVTMVQYSRQERSRIEAESTDGARQARILMAVGGGVGMLLAFSWACSLVDRSHAPSPR
jgi:hypothetical protein